MATGPQDLVLVGGGHAHVQVLRKFMMAPLAGVQLTLVLDRPEAVYSGMVPGFVAGEYGRDELIIDCVPLARRAGARVILSAATRIDAEKRMVEFADRAPLPYDVASLDVGSSVGGLDLPGVRQHAISTRPIADLVEGIDERVESIVASGGAPNVVVVGAGAAGVELASAMVTRLRGRGVAPASVTILDGGTEVLRGAPAGLRARLGRIHERQGISFRGGARVSSVSEGALTLEGGETLPADVVIWATGAAAPAVISGSPLPHDDAGYVRVTPTLQVQGHADLFAVGDCAALSFAPWVRKAGVYAVRGGEVLVDNLRAHLVGARLREFSPQKDFLALLNLGGGHAVGSRSGFSFGGKWVHRLKDRIDRAFMEKFQVLQAPGKASASIPVMGTSTEMVCGGCAAKVGRSALEEALASLPPPPEDSTVLLGLSQADDAAAVRLGDGSVQLSSIDAFTAFTDDPHLVGKVAVLNALSDLWAKGAHARHALALVGVADDQPGGQVRALAQVMAGMRAALDEHGVTLLGGHTIVSEQLLVGLSAWGEVPQLASAIPLSGARPGDALVLSRALGTGVLFHADMQGLAPGTAVAAGLKQMQRDNAGAAAVAREVCAGAATDVSGFGLAGHLAEMLRASGVSAEVKLGSLPVLPGVIALLAAGIRSTFHHQNEDGRRGLEVVGAASSHEAFPVLFDPQTCGGLLLAVAPERAADAVRRLREAGDLDAGVIGHVQARDELAAFRVVV